MHRNTFVFVFALAIIAALILGINIGRRTVRVETVLAPTDTPTVQSPTPTQVQSVVYSSPDCGFEFQYSPAFTLEEDETGGTLTDSQQPENTIIFACQEEIPRVPLTPDKIDTIEIGSVSAQIYHDASEENGSPLDKLIFTHPSRGVDIYIAGYGQPYNQLLQTLTILP